MEEIIDLNGEIYVLISFLEKYGVNRQTVINGMAKYKKQKSLNFANLPHPQDKRKKWIRYNSLTAQLVRNHSLPDEKELFYSFHTRKTDEKSNVIKLKLNAAYDDGYRNFQKHFVPTFSELDLVVSHARTMALFDAIKQLRQFDIPLHRSFQTYREYEGLAFETESIRVFYDKFRSFLREGHQAFIHAAIGKSKSKKVTQQHIDEIIKLFKSPQQFVGTLIHEKINQWAILNGYSQVSLTSVKTILADPYVQNQCRPIRNGKAWEQMYLEPWRLRTHPSENGEVWQLDGSRFQFPYYDGRKVTFMNLMLVFDVHSRKVIGHYMSKVEDHNSMLAALRNAIENVKFIPSQLVIDHGSAFKHSKFKQVIEQFDLRGSIVRQHRARNPRDKGHIERFFNTFQTTVCRGKSGYIGEGIKSKNPDARPREDLLLAAFNKRNARTLNELIKLSNELIEEYNQLKIGGRPSPEIAFSIAPLAKGATKVSENQIALMFWDRVSDYHVRNSMILLSEGAFRNKQFQYIIDDPELRLRINSTSVIVCFQKQDRSAVKIFTTNEKFLADVRFSEPISTILPNYKFDDNSKSSKAKKSDSLCISTIQNEPENGSFSISEKHQLYKDPESLEVILIKGKSNE